MDTKLIKCLVLLSTLLVLTGCTERNFIPYQYISEGVYLCEGRVWDGTEWRDANVTDKPALQYVTSDDPIELYPCDLVSYDGSLYSISNYRKLLLDNGYRIESETRTSSTLDTTLYNEEDRVRIIYQSSGSIRILFENSRGLAHIILEGKS